MGRGFDCLNDLENYASVRNIQVGMVDREGEITLTETLRSQQQQDALVIDYEGRLISTRPMAEVHQLHVSLNLSIVQLVERLHRMCEVSNFSCFSVRDN